MDHHLAVASRTFPPSPSLCVSVQVQMRLWRQRRLRRRPRADPPSGSGSAAPRRWSCPGPRRPERSAPAVSADGDLCAGDTRRRSAWTVGQSWGAAAEGTQDCAAGAPLSRPARPAPASPPGARGAGFPASPASVESLPNPGRNRAHAPPGSARPRLVWVLWLPRVHAAARPQGAGARRARGGDEPPSGSARSASAAEGGRTGRLPRE